MDNDGFYPVRTPFILQYLEFHFIYRLSGKSAERRCVFPERANHRMDGPGPVGMKRDCFAGHDGKLNGSSCLAHGNIRNVFESGKNKNYINTELIHVVS